MIKQLLSIRLRALFIGSVSGKDKKGNVKRLSPGAIAGYTVLYAFLFLLLFGVMFMFAFSMAMVLVPAGGGDFYYGIFAIAALTVVFLLSIFETKSELFECKDNELLLALPIKPSHIVVSRIFSVLVLNYLIGGIMLAPAIISYAICGGGIVGTVGGAVLLLTVPLLATALSAGVGYGVAHVAAKMKSKTFITLTASIVFLLIYFVAYFGLISRFDTLVSEESVNIAEILNQYSAICAIGSIATFSPIPFIIFVLLTTLVTSAAYFVISKNYIAIITASHSTKKKRYEARRLEQGSVFAALARKEMARYLSSANYILNSSLGVLFAVLITGFIVFQSGNLPELISSAFELEEIAFPFADILPAALISALMLCFGMNTVSASALSLEGQNLDILKSMPISSKSILLAKTVPHILVNAPISAVCGLVLAIATKCAPVYYFFYVLIPPAMNVFSAFVGILLNVAFPKFEFSNEVQVIKQSFAVFLAMIAFMLLSVGVFFLSLFAAIFGLGVFAFTIILCLVVALDAVLYFVIAGPAARKLDRL